MRFAKELEWSHKVALIASADIDFVIEKEGDTIYCSRKTDEPLGFAGGNQQFKVEGISKLFFEGKAIKELKIIFTRSGLIIPMGKITIESRGKGYTLFLDPGKSQRICAKET